MVILHIFYTESKIMLYQFHHRCEVYVLSSSLTKSYCGGVTSDRILQAVYCTSCAIIYGSIINNCNQNCLHICSLEPILFPLYVWWYFQGYLVHYYHCLNISLKPKQETGQANAYFVTVFWVHLLTQTHKDFLVVLPSQVLLMFRSSTGFLSNQ